MSGVTFGTVVPCRHCDGRGEVRHVKDENATKERARMRRRGVDVLEPPTMDPCPRCAGKGYLPPAEADRRA